MKKYLIINSGKNYLSSLFVEMEKREMIFDDFLNNKSGVFRGFFIGKEGGGSFFCRGIFFILFLPRLVAGMVVVYKKKKIGINGVMLFEMNEKIIFSLVAKVFGLEIIWFEKPESYKIKIGFFDKLFFRLIKNQKKIIIFNKASRERLLLAGVDDQNIFFLPPAIRTNNYEYQGDLFLEIAQKNGQDYKKKFFVVGTVVNLDNHQIIETLLRAVKICTEIIGNIQLVVVGDGLERKNLVWAAKKIGIEHLVWFVGHQKHIRKWLDGFDVYVPTDKIVGYESMEIVLRAMEAGLPVIGFQERFLEEVILENKTGGLVESENAEMFARQFIKLYQDDGLRKKLGQLARERVFSSFEIRIQGSEMEKICNK